MKISKLFLISTVASAGIVYLSDQASAATCTHTALTVKDANALTDTVPYAEPGDGSGNCVPEVYVFNGSPLGPHNTAGSPTVNLATDQTAADPCMFQLKTNVAVNVATAVSVQLVGLATSKTIYVCSLSLIGSTATIFSITGGTGTACATSPTAVIGSTTATATAGLSLAANGGLTLGNGGNMIAATGSGSELCLIQSGGGVIAGNLTYVQQ